MRILSGIQPSGKLHLGNYFGMMRPALELQEQGEAFLFIADYHALTTVRDPQVLRAAIRDVALDFLACGLDPHRTAFYRQSDVPEVTELTWLLSVVTPMGLLERCHSYKDKTAHGIAASHALFAYPVLMAADILSVNADVVPVGKDQKQHLEVTRDIANKFNLQYGPVFKIPEPRILEHVAVVPGTDGQKMSKSYNNTIDIFGKPNDVRSAIMRIVTDSKTVEEPKTPETCTVYQLYKLFASDEQARDLAHRYRQGGLGYGQAKKELYALFEEHFEPLRKKREELETNADHVDRILHDGALRAREAVRDVLKAVRRAVGLD
ncbi:MAG TPA: tryptophan--tRNA ligase [Kiritimatiellia bacterium]|nr:tryptophan--tRNA ligase [Kiritimatiellia bacterium]HMO98037.1 tryptophan--tRNA ligase [Kiritimatiellia bacterium]HMP96562.1 tryptophan--tRNA ligase [Kiritimatiellia bacterium]